MIVLSAALAAPALYNDDEVRVAGKLASYADLAHWAAAHGRKQGVQYTLNGAAARPSNMPYAALLLAQLGHLDGEAQVYDLYVPTPKGPVATSLTIAGNLWHLEVGTAAPPVALDLAATVAAAGLRPLGEKPWEATVSQAMSEALLLLSPEEKALIRGVGLQRVAGVPIKEDGPSVATYLGEGGDSRIEVYDPAAADTVRFVGTPERPYHPTSLVILHEVAHAIADASIRALLAEHEARRQRVLGEQTQLKTEVEAHNGAVRAHNRKPSPQSAARLQQESQRLADRSAALKGEVATLNRSVKRMAKKLDLSPLGAAYAREVGVSPTRYGKTSPDEAFAEAFALFKLDPAALEQLAPKALAWFREGRHLQPP